MSEESSRKLDQLSHMRRQAELGGGADKQEKERAKGKLSARERIDLLLDAHSFEEIYRFAQTLGTDFGLEDKTLPGGRHHHGVWHHTRQKGMRSGP